MNETGIYCLTAINLITAAILIPRYLRHSTVYQAAFVLGWTMHYVIGNLLVLLSQNSTYTLASFSDFSGAYLVSLIIGQYFLWSYLFLFETTRKPSIGSAKFRPTATSTLVGILAVTALFAALFIFQIGPGAYFSPDLARYRINLGEYAGVGIGVYYYLAMFLISASMLVGGFAIDHPRPRNLLLALVSIVLVGIVFVPLGGRGRVLNVIIILALAFLLSRREEPLMRALNLRTILVAVSVVGIALVWGSFREMQADAELEMNGEQAIASLAIDTTRLPNQAFIFRTFPATGSYFGLHYVESLLGPFYNMAFNSSVGLIRDYSSYWYFTTVGNFDQPSAVSPSFIGEVYLNFGIVGVILSPLFLFLFVTIARRFVGSGHSLATALILYYFQFWAFHGGLYSLFDLLVLVAPVFLALNFLTSRQALAKPRGASHCAPCERAR
ncbi:O-antigen polymerase [Methylosinus sp. PW1]|uniref:O-antigen polymerase n=1 Tax=Methylosinus sp. PW1 TaxID=107636 RepID=UPI00055C8858|nr:O-antigen polymerase [Methylosinus sp. PW1]